MGTTTLADARLGFHAALATVTSQSGQQHPVRARPTKLYNPAERLRVRKRFRQTVSGMQEHHSKACVDPALHNATALCDWLNRSWPLPGSKPGQCHVCGTGQCEGTTVFVTSPATAEDDRYENWWHLKLPGMGVVFLIKSES